MRQYQPVTLTFEGPNRSENADTFLDHRFDLEVSAPSGQTLTVPGFFAADGDAANTSASSGDQWRAKVLPLEEGTYSYEASFRCGTGVAASLNENAGAACSFDGASGTFSVAASDPNADGLYASGLVSQDGRLMRSSNGDLFIKGGPDSPEDLLGYSDFDNTEHNGNTTEYDPHFSDWNAGDPTWGGGQGKELIGAINYLASEGMNSISFIPMNAGGDADNTWPWTSKNDEFSYDVSKLAQWEVVFAHATGKGFFLHFKTQETENDSRLGGLSEERKLYYRELVARFGHHPALNWNLGEENTNSDAERAAFAQYFKDLDPYDHPVVVHTYPGSYNNVYGDLLGVEAFDGPSVQLGGMSDGSAWDIARTWLTRSGNNGDQWVCSIDEPGTAQDGVYEGGGGGGANGGNMPDAREVLWASYLAGCYGTEWYFGYAHPDDDLDLDDFRSRDTWFDQVRVALEAIRGFYGAVDVSAGTSHQEIQSGYVMEGESSGGVPQAVAYLKDGSSSYGSSYASVTYVNPRTGNETEASPSGGLDAPFSGDAVALLVGSSGGDGGGDAPQVSTFTLIDADTDEDLETLSEGDALDLSGLPTQNLNVRANTEGSVGSVVFSLSGAEQLNQTENNAPYALAGNSGSDYAALRLGTGSYTLEAVPFTEPGAGGEEGSSLSVSFTVVDDDGGGGNQAPSIVAIDDQTSAEGESVSLQVKASDPDGGDALDYSATDLPPGLSIDASSGLISGTLATGGAGGAFQEQNGLAVIEMESGNTPANWQEETSISSYTGDGYLRYDGGSHFNDPGNDVIAYEVEIAHPGTYRFQWRSRAGGSSTTDENDSWLKIDADAFYGEKGSGVVCPKGYDPGQNDCSGSQPNGAGSDGWFKVYVNSTNWAWKTATSDDDGHDIFARFDAAGTYTVRVAGRSADHIIDRMVLHRVGQGSPDPSDPLATSNPESSQGSGSGAAANSPCDVEVTVADGNGGSDSESFTFTVTDDTIPVELTSFEATPDGAGVVLRWSTASETGNAGFEVQQRSEGTDAWAEVGFVEGAGTTSAPQDYTYRVADLAPGRYFFRLRQVDYDDTETYHGEAEAVVEAHSFTLRPAAPNPFHTRASVRFVVSEAQPVRLELFNVLGRRVRVLYEGPVPAGEEQTVALRARELASGLYLMRLTGASQCKTQTVVLVK